MADYRDRIREAYFRFERFIDEMDAFEYDSWYDDPETTENQRDFADKIRETVSPEETEVFFAP